MRWTAAANLLLEQSVELSSAICDPQSVRGIYDPNESIRLFKVVSPV